MGTLPGITICSLQETMSTVPGTTTIGLPPRATNMGLLPGTTTMNTLSGTTNMSSLSVTRLKMLLKASLFLHLLYSRYMVMLYKVCII